MTLINLSVSISMAYTFITIVLQYSMTDKVEEHEQKISGFGYTDITMDTQVGATTVPDITGMNYIPVILRVSVAYDGLGVYGMASQNKWVVECKRVQNITIRFFKYPI